MGDIVTIDLDKPEGDFERLYAVHFRFEAGEYLIICDYLVVEQRVEPVLDKAGNLWDMDTARTVARQIVAVRTKDEERAKRIFEHLKAKERP